jgi:hypothetical protein
LPWCKILPPTKMLNDWTDTDHFPSNTKKIHTHMFKMITHFLDKPTCWSLVIHWPKTCDSKHTQTHRHTDTQYALVCRLGEILKWVELNGGT